MRNAFVTRIFTVLLIGIGLFGSAPNTVHALFGVTPQPVAEVGPVQGMIADTAAHTGVVAVSTAKLVAKETILDGVAFALTQGLIAAMTHSIVDWINNGFEGGPSFVTNLPRFLGEIADETRLDFIYNDPALGFICSPFQLDVRLALAVQQQPFHTRSICTLGDVTDNIDGFLSGDFSQGGWPAWFRLHTDIQNTPYGAYTLAAGELRARIASRQYEETQYLRFGEGFFSKRNCVQYEQVPVSPHISGVATTEERCAVYEIVTPGAQINDQLSRVLGSGFEQLQLADEINEIVNALIAQLAQQALTSIDGVRGLSSRSSASARTYVDASGRLVQGSYVESLAGETNRSTVTSAKDALLFQVERSLDQEEAYQAALKANLSALNLADDAVYSCFLDTAGKLNASGTIAERSAFIESELDASRAAVEVLESVRDQAARALSVESTNAADDAYRAALAAQTVHTVVDTTALENDAAALAAVQNNPDLLAQCQGTAR
ncbi:MAG: hypothetical protein ACE5F4_00100 [Candidatus Paceibacteria bacterium]